MALSRSNAHPLRALLFAGVFCGFAISGKAQSPPGPMTQTTAPPAAATSSAATTGQKEPTPDVPRTKNLAGSWKLNRDESTQPHDRERSGRGGSGGGRSGGGYPGGGRGGYG